MLSQRHDVPVVQRVATMLRRFVVVTTAIVNHVVAVVVDICSCIYF